MSAFRLLRNGVWTTFLLVLPVLLPAQESRWRELMTQATALRDQGKPSEGLPVAQEALRVAEKTFGADHLTVAVSANVLAMLYESQSKYAEAEPLYRRALAIREKALGPNHMEVAQSLNNLASLCSKQGKNAEAEQFYRRSLSIVEKSLGPENRLVALSLNNLAQLYHKQARYLEAEQLHKRSLAIRIKTLGPDHPEVAATLNNLGSTYEEEGKYPEAEQAYQRSLAIREKALGADHLDVAVSLNNLAGLYYKQARYAEEEPALKRSLAIREKTLGTNHPDVARAVHNLGVFYEQQGRYSEALPLFERALDIRLRALGKDDPAVAVSLNSLAGLFEKLGNDKYVEPIYKRSLEIREKVLGPDHPDVAESLHNLAAFYDKLGRYAEAEALYQRALAINQKVRGPEHPIVATGLAKLGFLYEQQGRYAEALPLYQRSLAMRERTFGPDHPEVGASLGGLADLYYAQGNYAQAAVYYDRALQNLSRRFDSSFAYMSERDRLQFLQTVRFDFDRYQSFCLTYHQRIPALAARMYDLLLWEKGLVGASVTALRAQIAGSGDAEALKLFDRLAARKAESARLASDRPQGWAESRKQVDAESNDLEQQLARRISSLGSQMHQARAGWRDVQKRLHAGEAAVEYARFMFFDGKHWTGDSKYVALVVTPEQKEAPALVPLGDAGKLEGDPLRDYRLRVGLRAEQASRGISVAREEDDKASAPKTSFYDAFWKPLESLLGGVKRIYLSPDGALNQVALPDVPSADGRLLLEKYDLRIVSTTKDLLREPHKTVADTGVLIGNPAFDLQPDQQRSVARSVQSVRPAALRETAAARSRDFSGATLKPLPGTQAEVQAISALLKKQRWQVETDVGQNALKAAVLRVKGPRLLHLATHGFFEADQQRKSGDQGASMEDPMLRSGLFFAGANRRLSGQVTPADLDDGVLTAYEASTLNLQGTDLVVLSACETGLGEVTAGEGVFGLRRALQVAGAEAVLMSMWAVPDRETQELMTLFYQNWLGGKDKHQALREAQLEMRARVQSRYGKDLPQYWGAFVLVGR